MAHRERVLNAPNFFFDPVGHFLAILVDLCAFFYVFDFFYIEVDLAKVMEQCRDRDALFTEVDDPDLPPEWR